jgi:hypothetical protein
VLLGDQLCNSSGRKRVSVDTLFSGPMLTDEMCAFCNYTAGVINVKVFFASLNN